MNYKLTKKQTLIFEFIRDYIEANHTSPTYREIMSAIGLSSVSAVAEHIDNLILKGVLRKDPGEARSLQLVELPFPETRKLFIEKIDNSTPDERNILLQAANILGLKL